MKTKMFCIRTIIICIFLFFSLNVFSQSGEQGNSNHNHLKDINSTIFFEDFEDGIPSDFILYDGDGLIPYYSFVDNAWIEYEGAALSTSFYYPSGTSDDWMITPAIFIPPNALLKWDAMCVSADWPDGYQVRISLDGTSPADFTSLVYSTPAEADNWITHTIDLSALGFGNQTIYLAFRNNTNDGWFLLVDNIKIYTIEQYDAGVVGFLEPQAGCNMTGQEDVTVQIMNFGYDTIFSLQAVYSLDGVPVAPETINDTILPFEVINYTFVTKADLTGIADRLFDAYTVFSPDTDPANDEFTGYIVNTGIDFSEVNYDMGFEQDDLTEFGLWNIEDVNNDQNTWNLYESGNGNFMYFDYSGGDGDDWLISRCFTLDPAKIYETSFWYYVSNSNDVKNLYLVRGIDQNSGSLTDTLIALDSLPSLSYFIWAHNIFTVSAGGVYYFGIHCTGNFADQEALFLDNFELREVPPEDIGVIYQVYPVSSCEMTANETLEIAIYNYGYQAVGQFSAGYTVNGQASVPVVVNQNINPGDTLIYIFPTTLDLSVFGNYSISTYTILQSDGYLANDTFGTSLSSAFDFNAGGYHMGFEPEDDFYGWTTYNSNNDDGYWVTNTNYYPHSGINSAAYIYSSSNQADDYLVSRCFYFEASKHYMISFWYAVLSSYYPEKLALYLVADQGPDKSPPALLDLGEIDNEEYLMAEKGFQVDSDGIYVFQWKAYSDPDMYLIFVDDIDIWQIDCSSPYVTPIELGNDTTLLSGGYIVLNAGPGFQEYHWSNGESTQSILVNHSGIYSVTALDTCLRESTDEIQIHILSLEENEPDDYIHIYPNPVKNELIIVSDNSEIISTELYDISGKKVFEITEKARQVSVYVSDLPSGMYMIKVVADDNYHAKIIIIE